MKRQRHSEEQIIAVLQEAQAGATIEELCRRHGISQGTYYKWKQKFSGMEVNDARRLRLLEDENRIGSGEGRLSILGTFLFCA
jgi:putative transposase